MSSAPPASPPPPARGTGASRYGWFVGVVGVLILSYITLNTLRTEGPGSNGPATGRPLPAFAAPLLLSSLEGDANVATPQNLGPAGKVPACLVSGSVLNSCDLSAGGPVVLGFFFTRGADCSASLDVMQRLSAAHPEVQFAAVVVRGDRDEARRIVRRHDWSFPIGFDRDGQVANLYGVAGCPEVVLAYPGGVVRETVVGRDRAERELEGHVAGLVAASRARGRPGRA